MKIVNVDNYIHDKITSVFKDVKYKCSNKSKVYTYYEYLLFDEIDIEIIINNDIHSKDILDAIIDENIKRVKDNLKTLLLKLDRMILDEIM